ncbi:hypothetical protein SynPROSU1_01458 [Synechococcus sp. PROS-U-1]|nr:hypothetical protein SynPROSU1_01458 [Synechococcus sp. PROS-U-1]
MELKIEIEQYFSNHLFNIAQVSRSFNACDASDFFLAIHHFPSQQITSLERVIKL